MPASEPRGFSIEIDEKQNNNYQCFLARPVRPYNHDSTASRLLSDVKHDLARLLLRWGTTLESLVLFFYLLPMFLYLLPILLHRIHNLNVPVPYVLVPLELCIKEEESLAFVVVESYQHLEG